MKKVSCRWMWSVLVGWLLLAACSQEKSDLDCVTFDLATEQGWGDMTRAAAMDKNRLCSSGFGVVGYYTQEQAWTDYKASAGVPNFMTETKVTSSNGGASWQYSPMRYWPSNPNTKVSFFAYAPYGAHAGMSTTKISFAVKENPIDQIDLLWSRSKTTDLNKNLAPVKFQFQHALARVGFNLKASVSEITAGVIARFQILNLKVTSVTDATGAGPGAFYRTGALEMDNTSEVASWSNQSVGAEGGLRFDMTSTHFSAANNEGLKLNNTTTTGQIQVNADDAFLMLIPQDFSAQGFHIIVEYKVELIVDKEGNTTPYHTYQDTSVGTVKANLESGKTYLINVSANMEGAKVEESKVEIVEWQSGGDVTVPGWGI